MKNIAYLAHRFATVEADHFAPKMPVAMLSQKLAPSSSRQLELTLPDDQCRDVREQDWRKYGGALRQCVSTHL